LPRRADPPRRTTQPGNGGAPQRRGGRPHRLSLRRSLAGSSSPSPRVDGGTRLGPLARLPFNDHEATGISRGCSVTGRRAGCSSAPGGMGLAWMGSWLTTSDGLRAPLRRLRERWNHVMERRHRPDDGRAHRPARPVCLGPRRSGRGHSSSGVVLHGSVAPSPSIPFSPTSLPPIIYSQPFVPPFATLFPAQSTSILTSFLLSLFP